MPKLSTAKGREKNGVDPEGEVNTGPSVQLVSAGRIIVRRMVVVKRSKRSKGVYSFFDKEVLVVRLVDFENG
jgi:hypothetical protein